MRSDDARRASAFGLAAAGLAGLLLLGTGGPDGPERAAGAESVRAAAGPVAPTRPPDLARGPEPHAGPVSRLDPAAAASLLRSWDERRALAWAADDARALRRLYVAGSRAGRSDLRLLWRYRARGLVVRRLTTQVFAIRVLRRHPGALRMSVFDRVAGGEVVRGARVRPLASTLPTRRTIEFRRTPRGWVVAQVSGSEPDPRGARP